MYVIFSNNGPWGGIGVGAVGGIGCKDEFTSFVEQHMKDSGAEDIEMKIIESGFDKIIEEEELFFYSAGETVLAALASEEDRLPSVYFLQEF